MGRTLSSVHLHAVSHHYAAGTPVLHDVTLDLGPGWHGVVGANGAGKSTLFGLLGGDLVPTAGEVHVVRDGPLVVVTQLDEEPGERVLTFAEDWNGRAASRRARLDLDPGEIARWSTLSSGERRRWQVAAALDRDPDVLLVDEPSNHLDTEARDVLIAELGRFHGLGLVVSHDRALLDALTTSTLRVVDAGVQTWAGSWSDARPRWEAEEQAARQAHADARREESRLRGVLGDLRRDRHQAETQLRSLRRGGTPDDREVGRKHNAEKAERKIAGRAAQLRTRTERTAKEHATAPPRRLGGDVKVRTTGGRRDWVLDVRYGALRAGDRVLASGVDLVLPPGERVRLHGPNGAGKSTLLRLLHQSARDHDVPTAWLGQELSSADADHLGARLDRLDPTARGRVLATVANLGVDPDRLLVTASPSPGELRKLALGLMLAQPTELLLLDEPTNHLDLASIIRLQQALAGHGAAMVLVTHDDDLAAATTTRTWELRDRWLDTTDGVSPRAAQAGTIP